MPTAGASFSGELIVRRRRFASEETGFAVLDCTAEDSRVILVGPIAHLEEDERARVSGEWTRDPRYGVQVRVENALALPPSDREALLDYLRRIKHIGDRRAQRLLERNGTDVLAVIDGDPAAAFRGVGLSGRRAVRAPGRGRRRLMGRAPRHARAPLAARAARTLVPRS